MQRYSLGRFSVSRIGFGAIQLPALACSVRHVTMTRRWRCCGGASRTTCAASVSKQLAAVNLRLTDDAALDTRFAAQLTAMIQARDEGLTGGVGLSNVTREHLCAPGTHARGVSAESVGLGQSRLDARP